MRTTPDHLGASTPAEVGGPLPFFHVAAETADGHLLAGELVLPPTEKATGAVLLFQPGLGTGAPIDSLRDSMARALSRVGVAMLYAQGRGREVVSYTRATSPPWTRLGGWAFEDFTKAPEDLWAWCDHLRAAGFVDILLAGHSFGAAKVVAALPCLAEFHIDKLALLAPVDTVAAHVKFDDKHRSLYAACEDAVAQGNGDALFNMAGRPVSAATYLALATPGVLSDVFPLRDSSEVRALNDFNGSLLIVEGEDDALCSNGPRGDARILLKSARSARSKVAVFVPGQHVFYGHEDTMTGVLGTWANDAIEGRNRNLRRLVSLREL